MNDEPATATALVRAEYHLFQITDPQGPVADDLDATQNGLVSAAGGAIEVTTGIHTGSVRVTVEPHSQRPDPAPDWEEIAEMPCHSPSGEVLVTPMTDDPADLPSLASQGPGLYRLRIHALGRDTAVDQSTDDVVESYLIQSWPAAHQDALLVKATDAYGAQVRARPASDTLVIDHEDSLDTQTGRERDILRRAGHGDYS
ncbi:hypothetical protein OHB41_33740 [Streptomyces sp. NBC_01571]|uniref:hypothetical protein n=1 Tax=Streptomyces sp. NBC_01571 TaxID=2975883 RepID=UPI0022573632|nr:hypothetical protein [Streptomyces sp. NBC_01571]MCX4578066.1 hypothetical protein [Streptomyces sp. NBC_01571]